MAMFDTGFRKVAIEIDRGLYDLVSSRSENRSALVREAVENFFQRDLPPMKVKEILEVYPDPVEFRVSFTMPRETVRRLETYAYKVGLSRSQVIRFAIRLYLSLIKV